MSDPVVLATVLAVALAAAAWWRARQGRVRPAPGERFSADDRRRLGLPAGRTALLGFTAPACAHCAAAVRVLRAVAADRDNVVVRIVSVADVPEVAGAHGVLRAPTVFAVSADGDVLARASGVPSPLALATVLDPQDRAA